MLSLSRGRTRRRDDPTDVRHWKLDQLTGLTEEAEQARDGILMYLGRLDATAKRYEEKRAAADIA